MSTRVNISKTGTWWRQDRPHTWIPYSPTPEESARAEGVTGVVTLCDTPEDYVRKACEMMGASIVEDTVILPPGYSATGPLSGDWDTIAKTLRTGVTQSIPWVLEGYV